MKSDVIGMLNGISEKMPSKETLNHPALIEYVTGLDVYSNTQEAYLRAYSALGIDIVNRVPDRNAPQPLSPGEVRRNSDYDETYLGVYDSACRHRYPYSDPNELLDRETPTAFNYHSLKTPVPHKLDLDDIRLREELLGSAGIYYYQLYTTLFMWGVEVLGWEVFMTAALIDPDRFDRLFLEPAFQESVKLIDILCRTDCPFVFLHDDIADASGPVFPPSWYDEFIFPRYRELFSLVKAAGKKVIFVADGNTESFLGTLRELGVDGVMLENPATRLEAILECFGDRLVIGGADTSVLTFGTPLEIEDHMRDLQRQISDVPGFIISSPGGIHGNIPLDNLIAYFEARVRIGATSEDWQVRSQEDIENRKIKGTAK
jgi:hypothetical protein